MDILTLAKTGNADDLVRSLRARSLFSPYFFTKVVLGYTQMVDHFHYVESERFINAWLNGVNKQWIEWPRGFFKSTQFTIGTSIWITLPVSTEDSQFAIEKLGIPDDEWFNRVSLHNQDVTQLLAFETIENAKKKIAEIKWHFEENQLFRNIFPEIAYTGVEKPWTKDCLKIRRVGYAQRQEEGTFEAIGVGVALQSRHYDIVWEDDLVGERAIKSETEMKRTIGWHERLSGAFIDAAKQVRFGVSNRWGYHDLNSHIRMHEPDFVFHTRAARELDSEGKLVPTFPERYSLQSLDDIAGSMTAYNFSCQYLNRPILETAAEVPLARIHHYTIDVSNGLMRCSCGEIIDINSCTRYMAYDPYNAKNAMSRSRPAIAVVAGAPNRHFLVLDYTVLRDSYDKIFQKLVSYNNHWRPHLFVYEDVGAQNMVEHHLRTIQNTAEFTAEKNRRFPRIIAERPRGRAKEVRIRDYFLPVITNANLAIREEHRHLSDALGTFPNPVLDHDYDLLDALAYLAPHVRYPSVDDEDKSVDEAMVEALTKSYSYYNEVTQ